MRLISLASTDIFVSQARQMALITAQRQSIGERMVSDMFQENIALKNRRGLKMACIQTY